MPHFIAEYSANLEAEIAPVELVQTLHQAVLASGAFPPDAVRTRAVRRDVYQVADGAPNRAFLAILCRIAPGRPAELRHGIGQALFNAMQAFTQPRLHTLRLSLTLEIQELDAATSFRALLP